METTRPYYALRISHGHVKEYLQNLLTTWERALEKFASSGLWGSCGKHNCPGVGTDTQSGVILVSRLSLNLKLTFEVLRKP